jgi:hypothetical protein
MASCGAAEAEIVGSRLSPAWVSAMQACIGVTDEQFQQGRGVCDGVNGRLRFELRATWIGGRRILERVRQAGADLPSRRPVLSRRDIASVLWQSLTWGASA